LLDLIKKELGLVPSRLCLDSLLGCCAKSGDLNNAHLVWREFIIARYHYDTISYWWWASNLYTIFPLIILSFSL